MKRVYNSTYNLKMLPKCVTCKLHMIVKDTLNSCKVLYWFEQLYIRRYSTHRKSSKFVSASCYVRF